MKLKNILTTALILFSFVATAQDNYKFKHLTVKDGLSHNSIYTIIQDNQGFLWAGTQNGLNKYDGYKFQNYYHDSKDSTSLLSENFGVLFQDSKGRIWLGTYRGGLSCYTPEKHHIVHYLNDPDDESSLADNMIRGITQDSDGNVWIATQGGLCKFDEATQTFKTYTGIKEDETTLSSNNIRDISYDDDGFIWVGTSFGLNKFNVKTGKNVRIFPNGNQDWLSSEQIQSLMVDSKGRVWVGTRDNGLDVYIKKLNKFIHYPPGEAPETVTDKRIQAIYEDSNGDVWIGTYRHGLNLYKSALGTFSQISNSEDDPQSLSHNTIEEIFEDNAQNLWIGTRGGGLNMLDLKPEKFSNFDLLKYKLGDANVLSIAQENENVLWVGTKSGLLRYDIENDDVIIFKNDRKNPNSLSNNRVRSLYIDNGVVWAGTYQGGLNKIEKQGKKYKITSYKTDSPGKTKISSNQINTIYKDKNGVLWVGTLNGVDKVTFDANGNPTFEYFESKENDKTSLSNRYVTGFFEDKKNRLWVLTSFGLNLYNPETNNFTRYFNIQGNSDKPESADNSFTDIWQTHDGRIWIGTNGSGLFVFNPENGKFSKPHKTLASSGAVMSIISDNNENLWISTSKGISKLNINTYEIINYDIADGLAETGFNRNTVCKTFDGTLYFGHISGYTRVRPKNIKLNEHLPTVVLTDFKKFNKSIFHNLNSFNSKIPAYVNEINLTYDDYVVSFDFAALDLTQPEKNKFAYKLNGFSNEWIEFGTQHQFMFTNLPSGKYTLTVKATNNDGVWCEESQMANITLMVKPPFWETWWFLLSVGTLIIFGIYYFIKRRTRLLKERNEMLEQKVNERTKALQETNIELEKLSIVARETDNSVTILDKHGNFEWFNEGFSKIFGYKSFKEFTNERGHNIFVGQFDENIKETVRKVLDTKQTLVQSNIVEAASGKRIWLQTTWTPILDDKGEISRLIAVDSDITNLKEVEEEVIAKNQELEHRNEEIIRYNENIRSSINYAKTIQNSILPFISRFEEYSEPFILFKPKDIVSGDFYWSLETEKYYFAAVVDCTGHGVPGAFMSLIGNRLLNEIVQEKNIIKPNDILIKLNTSIIQALNQTQTDNRDGMDVGLIRISKKRNEDTSRNIIFAGAKQDMFYYHAEKKEIIRIRGTRKSIGGKSSSNSEIFANERFTIRKSDVVYLLSDGFKDQNNKKRERFGTGRLMALLKEIAPLKAEEQKSILESLIDKYREGEPFRDDITILGLKIK